MKVFTCSCLTINCSCRENFISQSTTSINNGVTTTTEMYVNGEKVTKDNSIKVIFNKIKSRQKRNEIKNAMRERKKLKGKLN